MAEVLAQIPKRYLDDTIAFELAAVRDDGHVWCVEVSGEKFAISQTRLYS